MNKDLLNNPEVKEIAEKFALNKICKLSDIANSYDFDDFVREQTKPKEWEILQFTNKHNNVEWWTKQQFTGDFRLEATDHYQSINQLLANENLQINSVKRLSDGEVFTVGDEVTVIDDGGKEFKSTIHHFTYTSGVDIIDVYFTQQTTAYNIVYLKIEKAKQPLFKTNDGVDVFEGDEVWVITCDYSGINKYKAEDLSRLSSCFSTRKKAEEYILMNKPCLSVNDVMSFTLSESVHIKRLQEELTNLAKSKI